MKSRAAFPALAALLAAAACLAWRDLSARGRREGFHAPPGGPLPQAAAALLGNFRGIYVDFLWYKSLTLFTEDRERLHRLPLYLEPMGAMQPYFIEMWGATGWALAFNAAALFRETPEASWPWIRSGILRMKEGLLLNPAHPGRWKLHRELAWTYLRKCTPYLDPAGARIREKVREELKEEPFAESIRHFTLMEETGKEAALPATMVPHVWESWAEAATDPEEEIDRLRSGLRAWDRRGWTVEPGGGTPDHPARMRAHAAAAGHTVLMRRALAEGDEAAAHLAWWRACVAYARAFLDHRQFFLSRGGSYSPPPECVNWPYAARRLAGLGAPAAVWEELAATVEAAYAGLEKESAEEARILRDAGRLSEEARRDRAAAGDPTARFGGWSGPEILARAEAALAARRLPEAAAYLDRVLRHETDSSLQDAARRMAESMPDRLTGE